MDEIYVARDKDSFFYFGSHPSCSVSFLPSSYEGLKALSLS
jgi:hypothetical protein